MAKKRKPAEANPNAILRKSAEVLCKIADAFEKCVTLKLDGSPDDKALGVAAIRLAAENLPLLERCAHDYGCDEVIRDILKELRRPGWLNGTAYLEEHYGFASHYAETGDRSRPSFMEQLRRWADKVRKGDSSSNKQRFYTRPECPSCGKPGYEWITQKDFAKRTGMKPETVGGRVKDGTYCTKADKRVPWCKDCKEQTPEGGRGDVRPDSAFEPTEEDGKRMAKWAYDALRPFGLRKYLPNPEKFKGFVPKDHLQTTALECFHVAFAAICALVRLRGRLPENSSEAIGAAVDAIKDKRNEDIGMAMDTRGDMDDFSRPENAKTPWRANHEEEISDKNAGDLPTPGEDDSEA